MSGTKRNSHRILLAASVGAVALFSGQAAFAAAAADKGNAVEEVVVTAEKRSVNIQEVPASVSAIQGSKLQTLGLSSLNDYSQYIPGLVVHGGGTPGQTTVILRGIAPVGPGSVVGYYIDDTPLGSSTNYARASIFALDLMPYDVDQFEVLRGPQGTLYGAGAMGGLIKYVLKQADTHTFSGQVGGELSYTDHSSGLGNAERAAINIPLVEDKLAIRASIYNRQYQGYTDNVRLGEGDNGDGYQRGGRIAVTFTPTSNLRINLNAMWNRSHFDDNTYVRLENPTSHTEDGVLLYNGQAVFGPYGNASAYDNPFDKKIDYYSGTINWDLGGVTAISATSYSKTHTHQFQDATDTYGAYTQLFGMPHGVSYFDLGLDLDKWTQEFRLQSPTGGKFEWLVGAFYTHETSANHQLVNVYDANYQPITGPFAAFFNPFFAYAELPTKYEEYAFFGDLTWNIAPNFDVTGGLRYAHNSQSFEQISDGLILGGFTDQPGSSSEGVTTWSVNARYHFNDNAMLYARIATGYRPGGPNVKVLNVPPTVDSDTLTSYEAGLKSTFWDGRATFNISAFDIQWKNIQLAVSNLNCGCSYLSNGGDAHSRGFELEGAFVPTENLTIRYNAAYTSSALDSLAPGAPPYLLGYQLPGVPEFAGGATIDYHWPAFAEWTANVGAGVRYMGSNYPSAPSEQGLPTSLPNTKDPAFTTFDLRAGLSNDRFSANLFIRNVADKRVYTGLGAGQDPLTGNVTYLQGTPIEPRVIGISLDAKF